MLFFSRYFANLNIFMFLFLLALIFFGLSLVALAILGVPLLIWAYIELFGFRPNDLELGLCYVPYLMLGIAADMAVFGILIWLSRPFMIKTTTRTPTLLELLVAFVIVLGIFGTIGMVFVWPHADKLVRAERWPVSLELTSLSVDARDIQFGRGGKEYAQGTVRFEIINRLPVRIMEATFTIKVTPNKWSRFVVRDLAPGAVRRIERDMDFGNIMFSSAAGDVPGSPQRSRATFYCDRLRVEGDQSVAWGPQPEQRMVIIGDDPRVSIAGFWIDASGARMDLTQKGVYVAGSISGDPFSSYPNPLTLKFDSTAFTGHFEERAGRQIARTGTLTLTLNPDRRLVGEWTAKDLTGRTTEGALEFVRQGPESWSNRSTEYRNEMFKVFRRTEGW